MQCVPNAVVVYFVHRSWSLLILNNPPLVSISQVVTTNLFSVSMSLFLLLHIHSFAFFFFFQVKHINDITCICLSPLDLPSFSVITSRPTRIVANARTPFIFILLQLRKFSFFPSCILHLTQLRCPVKVVFNLCDCNYIKYLKQTHTQRCQQC